MQNVVGYNTFGHGFFIEDGIEENNTFQHNLGILVKPGIVLPTDRMSNSLGWQPSLEKLPLGW